MQTIYALTDPSGEVRYIGRTTDIERRSVEHFAASATGYVRDWASGLEALGMAPGVRLLAEVVDDSHAAAVERLFIEHVFAGADLLNKQRLTAGAITKTTDGPLLVAEAIRNSGLSQRAAGRKIGVAPGVITRWLNGERRPSLGVALRIRDAFGVPIESWTKDAGRP